MENSCFLDANCLIYFVQENSPFHQESVNIITSITKYRYSPTISPLCLDEFLYHISGSIQQKTIDLKTILKIPNIKIVNPSPANNSQLKVLHYMDIYKLKPRDAYHLMTMQTNKIKYFATFDNDFSKVFKSKILKQFVSPPQSPS